MKLYFLTRSITAEALASRAFDSSSAAYEVSLIRALRRKISVDVLNISGSEPETDQIQNTADSYFSMGVGRLRAICRAYKFLFVNGRREESCCVLTSGYYPTEMVMLLLLGLAKIEVFSIIYDTHISAIERFPRIKRLLAHWYFSLGLYCSGLLSGILIVNVKAGGQFPITPRRIFLTRIGNLFNLPSDIKLRGHEPAEVKTFLFAGTLNADNGVNLFLDSISLLPELDAKFIFYGSGDAEADIKAASKVDSRIESFGRVTDDHLDIELVRANFLVCLRDPASVSINYAFPSKLIKFMGSGTPVLANRFPGIPDEMAKCLLLVEEFSATAVARQILNVVGKDLSSFGVSAHRYVEKSHDWGVISDEMIDFFRR